MTVMLTPDFISSLTITDADAYVVATTDDGMVVGSQQVFGLVKPRLQFGEMIHQLLKLMVHLLVLQLTCLL